MNIEIDSKSKEWIESKGRHLTVKMLEIQGCCSADVQGMTAIPGKPKDIHHYHEFQVDTLSIYVQKFLCGKEKLTLKLSGISFLKSISAKFQ